ncbi:hypothetical protein [Clostridium sp.]|uniref:hypothetical protein n=1 Tax=Clostridium sp. TaxID=1506 RepID=UPI001A38B17C|nr:hypothetical protein [Clostridium sp.]MBK5242436.1 hypothetical protein [Clostridium sp.]
MINKFKKNLSLILTCIMIYSALVVIPINNSSELHNKSISQPIMQQPNGEEPPAL